MQRSFSPETYVPPAEAVLVKIDLRTKKEKFIKIMSHEGAGYDRNVRAALQKSFVGRQVLSVGKRLIMVDSHSMSGGESYQGTAIYDIDSSGFFSSPIYIQDDQHCAIKGTAAIDEESLYLVGGLSVVDGFVAASEKILQLNLRDLSERTVFGAKSGQAVGLKQGRIRPVVRILNGKMLVAGGQEDLDGEFIFCPSVEVFDLASQTLLG